MNITKKELVEVFTLWDTEYRENPEKFWSDVQHLLENTPDTYGDACCATLLNYLDRVREAKK